MRRSGFGQVLQSLSPRGVSFLFAALFLALLAPYLALVDVGGSSEAREITVASSIHRTGEWLLPLRLGSVPSKPPLFHWLTALISPEGSNIAPFWPRLVSLFFAALTIAAAGAAAARARALRTAEGAAEAALIAMLILASSYGFVQLAMDARVDMTFCFFTTLSSFLILGMGPGPGSILTALLAGLAAGAAVLAKGPLGLALPLIALFAAFAALPSTDRRPGRAALSAILISLAALIVAGPWYYWAMKNWGADFVARQIIFENLDRFGGGEGTNLRPWWFLLPAFLRMVFPWSIFCIWFSFKMFSRRTERGFGYWLYFVLGFALFCFSDGKRNTYIVPLFPAMAVFLSLVLTERLAAGGELLRARAAPWISGFFKSAAWAALLAALLGLSLRAESLYASFPILLNARAWAAASLPMVQLGLLTGGILLLFIFRSGAILRLRHFILAGALASSIFAGIISLGLGLKYSLTGFRAQAEFLRSAIPADCPVFVIKKHEDEFFDPVIYYLGREAFRVPPEGREFSKGLYLSRLSWHEANKALLAARSDYKFVARFSRHRLELRAPENSSFAAFLVGCELRK